MRTNYYSFLLFLSIFLVSNTTYSQTANFDETWKEFLINDKISKMSTLVRPDKAYDKPDYAKYLLMNANSDFCQSDVNEAEKLMEELNAIDNRVHQSIKGFIIKKDELESKMKAYYSMDDIWNKFLQTKQVNLEELEAVKAAKTSCEKKTLAKYSYMSAHHHLCQGNVKRAKDIFETRTLRLAEKTSLRINDVEGLAEEVRKMKSLFQKMEILDKVWQQYIDTGVSPGFDEELPFFPCYPVPNMKALILRGATDICKLGTSTLEEIKKLQEESGVTLSNRFKEQVKVFEAAIDGNKERLSDLDKAWAAFIPENKVVLRNYGYEYCDKEPLIKAYVMDGFAFTCELAEECLQNIDELQRGDITQLEETTIAKINELSELNEKYKSNALDIEKLWNKFTAQGDTLYQEYESTEIFCDNIHQAKDWVIKGYCGTCEEKYEYLQKIEAFQKKFEFSFTEDLECRIQNLRVKLWDCRHLILRELAEIDAASSSYEEVLDGLMKEYEMDERPEPCTIER